MSDPIPWDDPATEPFWRGALERRLLVQRCPGCDAHQFYPRPFCLACERPDPDWVQVDGTGTVYSRVEVHIPVLPELPPPYVCALVDLDEGPRLLTNLVDGDAAIGDRVRVTWRERDDAPPVPVFTPAT